MSYNDDTQWISTFTLAVTSTSDKVYANGRHQVEISVGVTPQDGEEITDEQLESIRLVRLDEDGEYQELSGELQSYSERDERFDFFQDPDFTAQTEALESAQFRKTFYVASTRPGESQDVLCAVITKDDDVRYISHSSTFEASVTLESIAPLHSSQSDFGLIGDDAPVEGLIEAGVDCDIYSLYFLDPNLRIVESIPRGAGEGTAYFRANLDISPWDDEAEEEDSGPTLYQNFYHHAYKVGEEKEFSTHGYTIPLNTVPGVMNFVRLKTTSETPETDAYHETSQWDLLDQYGNVHTIEMTQENDGDVLNFKVSE